MNAIKWSGSKRSQAKAILQHFPQKINTYYEPFCGGASVFYALVKSDISVEKYVLSDINSDLINLYETIKIAPDELCQHYEGLWKELNKDEDCKRKKQYFTKVRTRFNMERDPKDFMFIMRTTTNGMPRYNRRGEFNNSFHVTRDGISPYKLEKVVFEWSNMLKNVDVRVCDYRDIAPSIKEFLYLDPPYANTKGMYYGNINHNELWEYLSNVTCGWALSFNGIVGDENNTQMLPHIYDEHFYLKSGNSSFRRIITGDRNALVYESLYVKHGGYE